MVELEDVPEALRLNYFVGEIVITDSFAEHEARVLWKELHDAQLVSGRRPEPFGRLLPALLEAFQQPSVPADLGEIAAGLLTTTQMWHRYRRDIVHDLPVMNWGRTGDVYSAISKHPPRPMSEIARCAVELRTCGYRLRGLYIIAPPWLGQLGDVWDDAAGLRSWTRVAMGHVADVPHTIVGTEGPAPEPPGGWDQVVAAATTHREAPSLST